MADPKSKDKWKEKKERLENDTVDFTDFFFEYLHIYFDPAIHLA